MTKITPIILSGGIGTRLWPLSTKNLPKQFLKLPFNSRHTLFEQTIKGLSNLRVFNNPITICSEKHKFLVLESFNKLKINFSDIIVEKKSKNTATSVLLGVLHSMKNEGAEYSLIIPSDHYITNRDYSKLIPKEIRKLNNHIIFGIQPKFSSIEYGYIKVKDKAKKIFDVDKFFEKPNKTKAEEFVKRGFFWNSGIFLINNNKLLSDFRKYQPKIFRYCSLINSNLKKDLDFLETDGKLMNKIPEISFDNAILEKIKKLSMIKFKEKWTDLGSWNSLSKLSKKNVQLNSQAKIINNTKNSFIISDKRNTVLNDVSDIIVVCNKESLLISSLEKVNEIKTILTKKKNQSITKFQNVFYKPWGHYETFIASDSYLVKKLTVKPKHRLSLQYHKYRAEHWIVVEGNAQITKGDVKYTLKKNESTFIPLGVKHCIENIGKNNLEIIEIQMGKILKESDIVRLDDPYKRKN